MLLCIREQNDFYIKAEIYDSVNILQQRIVAMERDCNACAPNSHLISLSGYTEGKKLFPFSHYQRHSPLSVSVTEKSAHSHSLTAPHSIGVREAAGSIQRTGGRATWLGSDALILLSMQSAQLKSSSSCPNTSEGSSPVSFDWQRLCRRVRHCVHRMSSLGQTTVCQLQSEQRVMWEDGRGWKWAEGNAASGIREPCLACGIWLPQRRAAAAPQALTDTQLANAVRVQRDDTACSTPAPQLESTPSSWLGGRTTADKLPRTTQNQSFSKMKATTIFSSSVGSGEESSFFVCFWLFNTQEIKKLRQESKCSRVRMQWTVSGRFQLEAAGESSVLQTLLIRRRQLTWSPMRLTVL